MQSRFLPSGCFFTLIADPMHASAKHALSEAPCRSFNAKFKTTSTKARLRAAIARASVLCAAVLLELPRQTRTSHTLLSSSLCAEPTHRGRALPIRKGRTYPRGCKIPTRDDDKHARVGVATARDPSDCSAGC